jgi:hypothetical protein
MRGLGRVIAVPVVCAAALAPTAEGSVTSPHFPFDFKVPGSNGYRVEVVANHGGSVTLTTISALPGGGSMGAAYVTKGRVSSRHITARFGSLGALSARVRSSGGRAHSKQCHNQYTYVSIAATYRGRVRFQGENGYVSVDSSRLRPTLPAGDPINCGLTLDRFSKQATVLHTHGVQPASTFVIEQAAPGATAFAFAQTEQELGRMKVFHYAEVTTPPSSFSFDAMRTSADVQAMPAPFQGSAHFAASPGQSSGALTGSLSAAFPGAGTLSLVGPTFSAQLESYFLFNGKL